MDLSFPRSVMKILPDLQRMIRALDKKVEKLASAGYDPADGEVYTAAEKIIDLTEKKVWLINLKVIAKNMLTSLSCCKKRKALCFRYVYGLPAGETARLLDISERSVFRIDASALKECAEYLEKMGYDEEYFKSRYEEMGFLHTAAMTETVEAF